MMLRKIQRGRLELAGYILLPVVLFVAITALEGLFCRSLEQEIAFRRMRLKLAPEMEKRLSATRERLKRFTGTDDAADGTPDLTMRVNRSAQENGLATRAVKLDRLPLAENSGWSDYKVAMGGEGSMLSLIRFIDEAEQNGSKPLRVMTARIMVKSLSPEPVYDADLVFMSRTLHCEQVAAKGTGKGVVRLDPNFTGTTGVRIDGMLAAMEKRQRVQAGLLPLGRLRSRQALRTESEQVEEAPFQLTGVIKDAKRPLAMTDQGLMGVGDERGGFRVVEIRDDAVVVENRHGVRTVLHLYSGATRP